jgi:SNF2 family DNA or RNA helicase
MEGNINAAVVICPTAIKPVWKMELEKHCPLAVDPLVLESGSYSNFKRWTNNGHEFKILIVGIEALSQGGAADIVMEFIEEFDCMVTVDESSRIKNYKAERTKVCWQIAGQASWRMIMTGTPITQGIHDLFAQFRFLNWEIIGMTSYFVFRNRYCILGGFEGKQIIGYMNVPELIGLTAPYVFQIEKKDVLDLPDKVYQTRIVEPNPAQRKAIKELGDIMETTVDDLTLEVETILERLTRYQQIAGGNFPYPVIDPKTELITYKTKPMPGKNPKLEELKSVVEETGGKIVIWARFIPEMEAIEAALKKTYGEYTVVTYRGGMTSDERGAVVVLFQEESSSVRFFIANQQTGSLGLTLTASHTVIYYSNSFSYEDRVQSEDRNHRIGTKHAVDYIDLTLNHKVDQMIIEALAKKKGMAQYVTEEIKRKKNG